MVVKMNRLDRLPAGVDPRVPSPYCMRHCFLQQPALLTPGNDCKISAGSKPPFVVRHVSPKFLLIFNVAAGNIYGERERKEERRGWKRRGKREERERESQSQDPGVQCGFSTWVAGAKFLSHRLLPACQGMLSRKLCRRVPRLEPAF